MVDNDNGSQSAELLTMMWAGMGLLRSLRKRRESASSDVFSVGSVVVGLFLWYSSVCQIHRIFLRHFPKPMYTNIHTIFIEI